MVKTNFHAFQRKANIFRLNNLNNSKNFNEVDQHSDTTNYLNIFMMKCEIHDEKKSKQIGIQTKRKQI